MNCIFCSMVQGKTDFIKVYEDDFSLAIIDLFPSSKGQSLIIPKTHREYIFDLNDEEYQKLFSTVKLVAKAIDRALNPLRTCIVVEGFQLPHLHVRLHPCYQKRLELHSKGQANLKELQKQAEKIQKFL